jgi:predicted PurR-regulated permease PerM
LALKLSSLFMRMTGLMTARRALGWLAVAAAVSIVWLARPFLSALLLGALMAFTLEPVYAALARHTRRPFLASLTTVLVSGAVVGGALAGFVSVFVARALGVAVSVREGLRPGGVLSGRVDAVSGWLAHLGITMSSLNERLEAGAGEIASQSARITTALASSTLAAMLGLFFAVLAMHLVLLHWSRIVTAMVRVSPLQPEHTRTLLDEFRRVGRQTVSGTVITGLAQGLLAAIGYWIGGVPLPIFFGIATALASLIPAVGTLLIWIPAGVYLIATDHPARAMIELSWGALMVVGFSDYVIRPRMVGDAAMPTLLVFIALFGGLEAFGLSGLILGPVLMAVAVAVLRLYAQDNQRDRVGGSPSAE